MLYFVCDSFLDFLLLLGRFSEGERGQGNLLRLYSLTSMYAKIYWTKRSYFVPGETVHRGTQQSRVYVGGPVMEVGGEFASGNV